MDRRPYVEGYADGLEDGRRHVRHVEQAVQRGDPVSVGRAWLDVDRARCIGCRTSIPSAFLVQLGAQGAEIVLEPFGFGGRQVCGDGPQVLLAVHEISADAPANRRVLEHGEVVGESERDDLLDDRLTRGSFLKKLGNLPSRNGDLVGFNPLR